MPDDKKTYYIHGSHPEEQERLSRLNVILNKRYIQEMALKGGETILDVGSGLGQFTRLMARTTGGKAKVLGIERDPDQIITAQQLAIADKEEELVEYRQGDAMHLPLQKEEWNSFDIAHTRFLLEHISKPEQVIQQMLQAVKPGGRVILSDDDHATFMPTPEPAGFSTIWQAYLRSYDRMGNDPYIGRRLVILLHQAGAKNIQNTVVFFGGCAHESIFTYVADNLIGILMGAKELMLREQLIEPYTFDQAIQGLYNWKKQPDAALWYGICWAEGIK